MSAQAALAAQFHALHHAPAPLVLPNAWDAGSAVIFAQAGFAALGTTSAGIAYAQGRPDGAADLAATLAVLTSMRQRVAVPLTADIESGYGAAVAATRAVIGAGAVGINLEDGLPDGAGLTPLAEQCALVRAVAALKTELGVPFFINARIDTFWLELGTAETRLPQVVERGQALIAAGADGLFVPGRLAAPTLRALAAAFPVPLNVLPQPDASIAELAALGAARISLGSGAVRAALGLVHALAHALRTDASLALVERWAPPYAAVNAWFAAAPVPAD